MSRDRKCTHSTCNGHAHFYKARRIDVHWPLIIFGQMSWHGMPARQITLQSRHEEQGRRKCDPKCLCQQRCLPSKVCSVKYQVHHSHFSNKMTIALLAASVNMPGTFKVAISFASTFQCTSRTYLLNDHVEPFAAGWCLPFSKNNCMLTPRTTRGNWRKKKKRSPARNRSEHHLGFGTSFVSRFWLLHDGSQPWSHVGTPLSKCEGTCATADLLLSANSETIHPQHSQIEYPKLKKKKILTRHSKPGASRHQNIHKKDHTQ